MNYFWTWSILTGLYISLRPQSYLFPSSWHLPCLCLFLLHKKIIPSGVSSTKLLAFRAKMNHCNIQQNATVCAYEEIRGIISISDGRSVVCPKPRRNRVLVNTPIRPLRLHTSHQAEVNDMKAGAELLDIILKRDFGTEQSVPSSPPFFRGSPPSRAANPLVQDARFGDEKLASLSALQVPSPSSPSARKGGCARMKFGLNPATVRVEGFDCLNRDRQNSGITAMA